MNGFGFIEYKDALDARDVVPGTNCSPASRYGFTDSFIFLIAFHGSDFMGERLTVQFARGSRSREAFANTERTAPRPRRTPHRMQISGLPGETSWQVRVPRSFLRISGDLHPLMDAQHSKLDVSIVMA